MKPVIYLLLLLAACLTAVLMASLALVIVWWDMALPDSRAPLPVAYPASQLPMPITGVPDGLGLTEPDAPGVATEHTGDALRVTYAGAAAASIPLCEVRTPDTGGTFVCDAELRGVELDAPAYLELWFVDDGQAWFSRALADKVTGPTEWRRAVAHFRADRAPDAVLMGLRFEGPGAVEVRGISLRDNDGWRYAWLPGTLIGVMAGLWGSLCGLLVPRGKGRRVVMALGTVILACALVMLLQGIVRLVQGAPYAEWYPSILPGIVGTAVLGSLLPVVRARYAAQERERMAARERSDSLH